MTARRLLAAVSGLALGLALTAAPMPLLTAPAEARTTVIDLADLAEKVMDAVVNISTTTNVKGGGVTGPQLDPKNAPEGLRELFEDLLRRRGQGGEQNEMRKQSSLGSGFVIDAAGIVVTNNHVIDGADEIVVILADGTKLKAELIGRDKEVDLAVLKVKPEKPLKAVKFADSDKIRIGEPVMAIGNPLGLGGTVTSGIISAKNRDIKSGAFDNYIQTDAAINRGNSGGPLFNMDGDVIGINTAIFSQTGGNIGIAFAVPSNTASNVVKQLQEFGETRRGWLGVGIQEVSPEIAESLGLKGGPKGALVQSIDPKGPSFAAGMKTGDLVLKFDGQDVKNSRELPRIVSATAVGKTVDVVVLRDGKETTLQVKLGRREDGLKEANLSKPGPKDKELTPKTTSTLGLDLSEITPALRSQFGLKDDTSGVVITKVDPSSAAADQQLQPGYVIEQVQNEAVKAPADLVRKVDELKKDGRKSALLLVSNAQGQKKFVALSLK